METTERREEGIWEVRQKESSPTGHENYVFDVCTGVNEKKKRY